MGSINKVLQPTLTYEEGKKVLKAEINWSADDDKLANYNNKVLHVIFNGFDVEHIKLISSCESANEAWVGLYKNPPN